MTDKDNLPPSTLDEINHLIKSVIDLEALFSQQRKALREQGANLPIGTQLGLQQLRMNLEGLAKSSEESQVELQRLRALSRTAELVNSSLDLDYVLNEVIDTAIQLTKAERGYLMLINPETDSLEFRVARNIEQRSMAEDEFIVSRSIAARVAKEASPIVTTNAAEDARFAGQQSIVGFTLRSILCVPLVRKGQVVGVVYADNRMRQGVFGDKELKLLRSFADQAAIAIENARQFGYVKADLEKAQREVQELRIQIDQKRLSQEVDRITDSGFFQELQAKVRTMRDGVSGQPDHQEEES
jgi:adenylate cyclase